MGSRGYCLASHDPLEMSHSAEQTGLHVHVLVSRHQDGPKVYSLNPKPVQSGPQERYSQACRIPAKPSVLGFCILGRDAMLEFLGSTPETTLDSLTLTPKP